ncbi:MAG TPA: endo-1,4-beta-xylanase [Anaeromyxobacter sp.]|nr:endo-1,4-beta-xylanase [Anaeromyxobacter sp.]
MKTVRQAAKAGASPEVVVASGCGYELTTGAYSSWPGGYQAWVQLTNRGGAVGTSFQVLLDVGETQITQLSLARYEAVEGGYVVTEPGWLEYQKIPQGKSYRFQWNGSGAYPTVQPYLISINGVACDTHAPSVQLVASASFLTSNGKLTLTAVATDDVAVRKVVFLQDGEVIAADAKEPYTAEVEVTAALNGRHTYTAKAIDPSGNETISNAARLFVAIGDRFFGTATDGAADFDHLVGNFDQLTPGNAGKWGSVEAVRDVMDWAALDLAYAFAKQNGLRFKMHTMIWGQQQPGWLTSLSVAEQREEIEEWFAAVAERYPDLEMIDLVNEPLHAPPAYAEALGGAGATGWDWVITAFELGREYFPNAQLILNDYNILILPQATSDYVALIDLLKARDLIDGVGEQAHFLERAELPTLQENLDALAATGLPIYISELDVNFADDARHARRVSELFTMFWSNPSVVGITHWGHLQGRMWRPDAYLIRTDGSNRPAMDWIVCFTSGRADCPLPVYVPQPRVGDATGLVLQAEEYDDAAGILAIGDVVAYTDDGDWERFDRVQLQQTWDTVAVRYAKGSEGPSSLTVHLDSLDAAPVVTVPLPPTAGWGTMATQSVPLPALAGEHAVFVKFNGGYGVGNVDSITFSSSAVGPNVIANGDFESGTDGWFTWSGTIGTTTASAQKGSRALIVTNRPGNGPAATTITNAVVPGTSYQVSFWVSIAGAAQANVNLTQKIRCSDGSDQYSWLASPVAVPEGQWVELTGTLAVPNCPLGEVTIYAEGPGAGIDLLVDNVSARAPTTTNLIPDGTFESGVGSWFSWNGVLSTTSALAHGGSRSLVSTGRTGNGPVARSLMGIVEPGKTYQVSFWVSVGNAASADVNLTRKFSCQGQSDSYSWVVNPTAVTSGGWVQLSGTLAVPSCTLTDALIYAEGPGAGIDLYVDDVTLSQ